jgi:hypothetical protein
MRVAKTRSLVFFQAIHQAGRQLTSKGKDENRFKSEAVCPYNRIFGLPDELRNVGITC